MCRVEGDVQFRVYGMYCLLRLTKTCVLCQFTTVSEMSSALSIYTYIALEGLTVLVRRLP